MILNLSNLFTFLRVLISPFIFISIMRDNVILSIILFIFAALTDFLDGYTARLMNLQTVLGTYLDPLADKIFLLSCFIALTLRNGILNIPVWFVIFMVCREFIIVIGAIIIKLIRPNFIIKPTIWGRLNTLILILFIFSYLIFSIFSFISADNLQYILLIVTFFSFFSLMDYIKIGIKQIRDKLVLD